MFRQTEAMKRQAEEAEREKAARKEAEAQQKLDDALIELPNGKAVIFARALAQVDNVGQKVKKAIQEQMVKYPNYSMTDFKIIYLGETMSMDRILIKIYAERQQSEKT